MSQRPTDSQLDKATGTCPICQVSSIRLTRAGLLYNHGPRGSQCPGVGSKPLGVGSGSILLAPITAFSQTQSASPNLATPNNHSTPTTSSNTGPSPLLSLLKALPPMIKWIPRSARPHCSSLLTKIITNVVSRPNLVLNWEYLLLFGRIILSRPSQGGSRRNLTNILVTRCRDLREFIDKGETVNVVDTPQGPVRHGLSKDGHGQVKDGSGLGRAVSLRLEDGNFKGAVRLITSDEVLAKASKETLDALHDKHPSTPLDRRPAPPIDLSIASLTFVEAVVRKAIFSFPPGSSGGPDGLSPQHLKDLITCEGINWRPAECNYIPD